MSEPTAYVSIDLDGVVRPIGTLYAQNARGKETASFQYDPAWLEASDRFALAPALVVTAGAFYTAPGHALFGALSDSAPDRWGQTLIRRAELLRARTAGTTPRTLRAVDFLLGVSDSTRQGAIRFRLTPGGEFVAPEGATSVPPLVDLPRLLSATEHFLADEESDDEVRWLLAPGSSLGGARPKASVRDRDGQLLIAKFPRHDDPYRVVVWEAVALDLAKAAGIAVPRYRLESVAGRDVLLVSRFDRTRTTRIPYLSAMSLLDAFDGDTRSYVEIADALRAHGAGASADLKELWRRLVFSVLISNTDDHLRNHGMLYVGPTGWRLSPVFDVNPVPLDIKARMLSTTIAPDGDPTASLERAREVAAQFGLSGDAANAIIREVGTAVRSWRRVAVKRGIATAEIDRMASAFEHADLASAVG